MVEICAKKSHKIHKTLTNSEKRVQNRKKTCKNSGQVR